MTGTRVFSRSVNWCGSMVPPLCISMRKIPGAGKQPAVHEPQSRLSLVHAAEEALQDHRLPELAGQGPQSLAAALNRGRGVPSQALHALALAEVQRFDDGFPLQAAEGQQVLPPGRREGGRHQVHVRRDKFLAAAPPAPRAGSRSRCCSGRPWRTAHRGPCRASAKRAGKRGPPAGRDGRRRGESRPGAGVRGQAWQRRSRSARPEPKKSGRHRPAWRPLPSGWKPCPPSSFPLPG